MSHHDPTIGSLLYNSACIDFIFCSYLSVMHLYPNYFSNPSKLHTYFYLRKKGKQINFTEETADWVTFSTPSALMFAFLYIWQCTSRKMSTSDTFTEGGYTADGRKMWLWGQKHCPGRCLQDKTSERPVSSGSDRQCHARLPEAFWSFHLTSWVATIM